jgi:hypothetical protein
MPITRKPKSASNGHLPKAAVSALIAKGGSPAGGGRTLAFNANRGVDIPVIVRVPESDLISVDTLVMRRPVKIPRHTWLLEAIHEKIVREKEAVAAANAAAIEASRTARHRRHDD